MESEQQAGSILDIISTNVSAHPYVVVAIITLLIIVIIMLYFDIGGFRGESLKSSKKKKDKGKTTDKKSNIEDLVDDLNEKQK